MPIIANLSNSAASFYVQNLDIYLPVLLIGSSFLKQEACGPVRQNAHAAAASPVCPSI